MKTTIVNIKVAELRKRNINSFLEWDENSNNIYIGRNTTFYVPGTVKSKWFNPFSVKKHGLDEALVLYENYIRNHPTLYNQLEELECKTMGCWCHPNKCHGDILLKLLLEKKQNLT